MAITSIFARPVFLSTLSLRRATDREFMTIESSKISIHALLAESDERRGQRRPCGISISIHALLAESDAWAWCWPTITAKFLSTLSLRRATLAGYPELFDDLFLSTLSLRRATWYLCMYVHNLAHISIHALLAESDSAPAGKRAGRYYFYPRSPCGERRILGWRLWDRQQFLSTLSLRRATLFLRSGPMMHQYFYPRSPCGERLVITPTPWALQTFLSTLSLRRATQAAEALDGLRENFYPRSPCGERLCDNTYTLGITDISIHALLAESDRLVHVLECSIRFDFYPRSPCGERLRRCTGFQSPTGISIHALLAESDRQYTLYGCL